MVGFSLAHIFPPIFLAPLFLLLWMAALVVVVIVGLVTRRTIARVIWLDTALAFVALGCLLVPYRSWQRLFVARIAASPKVGEFMVTAAAEGDLSLVQALVAHGAPIDATNHVGTTGLHAAALTNQLPVLHFLAAKGASIDALDRFGDSPLESASSRGAREAVQFLQAHGAHRVHGSDAQYRKAIEDSVRESIEGK